MSAGVVNIRGREYKTVALRVSEFRDAHSIADGWAIRTEPVSITDEAVLVRAEVVNPAGVVVATGYAEEVRASSSINRTSALENCETSAIGRALAAAGFGGSEYASANEVEQAIYQQNNPPAAPPRRRRSTPKQADADPLKRARAVARSRLDELLAEARIDESGHRDAVDRLVRHALPEVAGLGAIWSDERFLSLLADYMDNTQPATLIGLLHGPAGQEEKR